MKRFEFIKICLILGVITVTTLWPGTDILAQDTSSAPKRVLAIFLFKQGIPWQTHVEQGLRKILATESVFPIHLDVEYADQTRFPEEEYRSKIIDLYRYKYGKQNIDLVLVMGGEPAELVTKYGEEVFGEVPVVLISTQHEGGSPSLLKSNMVSMTWGFEFIKTGVLIQDLLPKTKDLFVVSGASPTDLKLKKMATEDLGELESQFAIHHLAELSLEALLLKVTQLPENSAILFLSMFRDRNGKTFVPRDVMAEVSAVANVPTFATLNTYMGYGIVGGSLLSADTLGEQYAGIVKQVLTTESLKDIELPEIPYQITFDWRQLKRWSINENRLPADSIVLYREKTIWSEHKREVISVIVIISLLSFALFASILQYRRRSLAEEKTQKLLDERAHLSRVLAMGEIAASLAHELNQPLSAIRSYAQAAQRFLEKVPAQPDEANRALTGIIAGNRRAEEVIKRVRMALKKEPFKRSCIEIRAITEVVVNLIRQKVSEERISLRLNLAAGLPPLFCDRVQLQQVIFNLIRNSIEAINMVEGGPRKIVVQALMETATTVRISVQDSGIGIDADQVELLFDAFYTTKPEGMGVGLSICRSIIEDHGGRLWVTRNPDRGATFSFTLPICEDKT